MADMNVRAVITADDQATKVIKGVGDSLRNLGLVAGGLVTFSGLAGVVKDMTESFSHSQDVSAQLQAVLQSTGGVAGVTAKQAEDLAHSFQNVTQFSDETVGSAENMLLTFTNIGRNIFPQATQATLDLAQAMGVDTREAAIQVGKALNDPVIGTQNLRRVGVEFNQTTQDTIKALVDEGKGMEAQKMILAELTKEFGGSATAAGKTFAGQMKILGNQIDDVKERIGGVLAQAISPFVQGIGNFVTNNQQLVTSLVVAGLAAGGFAAAVIAVAGAIAIAVTIIGGPLTLVLAGISLLFGGVVFAAVQKFQQKMADTTKTVVNGSKQMASDGANNFGATGQAASDLADKLAKIDDQMTKTTRDFNEQLKQIVVNHQQKVSDLQKQLADENKSFTDDQASKASDFQQTTADMVKQHQQKVNDITTQMKAEQIAGAASDSAQLNSLRLRLAQENESFNTQVAENQKKYNEDTAKAVAAHTAKKTDFENQLDEEKAFLAKHNADIKATQNVQLLDEIDKLKRTHQEEMKSYDDQKNAAIKSARDTTAGMANSFNALPGMVNKSGFGNLGSQMGKDMGKALQDSVKEAWNDMWKGVGNRLNQDWKDIWSGDLGKGVGMEGTKLFQKMKIPGFAEGGVVQGPTNAPTLAVVHGGETVTPVGGTPPGGGNFHFNFNGPFMGTPAEARQFARMVVDGMKDVAGAKNMTVGQLLS
jgi:hypothetical protein